MHAVALAGPLRPRRRRDGQRELGNRGEERLHHRPLPGARGPVTTKTGLYAVEEVNQLLPLAVGEAADRLRLADPALVEEARAFTRPNFGTAMSMSKTFAVETYSGGSREDLLDRDRSGLEVLLQLRPLDPDVVGPLERLHSLVE